MKISPNSYENVISLRDKTLIPNPNIIKSFNLLGIDKNVVTLDALATMYPNILYNRETGLFTGYYRDSNITINFWEYLKYNHKDLYDSQLANLTSAPHPNNKNREKYKKFLDDHQLLINTMEVFRSEWRQYFKSVLGIPDDHKDYKIFKEWAEDLQKSLDFISDFMKDGWSAKISDEGLLESHQRFIDCITIMSVTGSNNPFKLIINQELKDATLDKITFSNAVGYVEKIKFDTLEMSKISDQSSDSLQYKKRCLCISNCELSNIDSEVKFDLLAIENSIIHNMPEITVSDVVYLDNVKSNQPINLDIFFTDALLLKDTNISDEMYNSITKMIKTEIYPFTAFKNKGVVAADEHHHINGFNRPPVLIEGTFIKLFKQNINDNKSIAKFIKNLNTNDMDTFAVYTDDPKMMDIVFKNNEGTKYKGIPSKMFYLFKTLLNK